MSASGERIAPANHKVLVQEFVHGHAVMPTNVDQLSENNYCELVFEIALPIIRNTSEFDTPFFIIGTSFRRTLCLAYLSTCGVTHVYVNLMKPWCVGVYVEAQLLAPGMFQSCPQLQALALRISSLPCYAKLTSNLRTLMNRIRAAVKVRHFHSTWYNALNTSIVLAKMLMHDL